MARVTPYFLRHLDLRKVLSSLFDLIQNYLDLHLLACLKTPIYTSFFAKEGSSLRFYMKASLIVLFPALATIGVLQAQATGSVFRDFNGNGIQDANEASIPNVNVTPWKETSPGNFTAIAGVLTDSLGRYIFTSASGTSTTGITYGVTQLQPNMNYELRFPVSVGGLNLTIPNNGGADPNADAPIRMLMRQELFHLPREDPAKTTIRSMWGMGVECPCAEVR